jgi:hypothetical protein
MKSAALEIGLCMQFITGEGGKLNHLCPSVIQFW